jgi:hypothetical protein
MCRPRWDKRRLRGTNNFSSMSEVRPLLHAYNRWYAEFLSVFADSGIGGVWHCALHCNVPLQPETEHERMLCTHCHNAGRLLRRDARLECHRAGGMASPHGCACPFDLHGNAAVLSQQFDRCFRRCPASARFTSTSLRSSNLIPLDCARSSQLALSCVAIQCANSSGGNQCCVMCRLYLWRLLRRARALKRE